MSLPNALPNAFRTLSPNGSELPSKQFRPHTLYTTYIDGRGRLDGPPPFGVGESKAHLVPMPRIGFVGRVAVRDTEATHTGGVL